MKHVCGMSFKRDLFRPDRIVTELRMICCRNGGSVCYNDRGLSHRIDGINNECGAAF